MSNFIRRLAIALQLLHDACTRDLRACRGLQRGITICTYANNRYAGHAPATVADFLQLWKR